MDVAAPSLVGQTVSHYRIVSKLGGGGMGAVYDAEDTRLGRHVALKFVPPELVHDRKALERFFWEARAASQLNHPGICTIHDIEDSDGHPFIVMERLEGVSLKERILGKPMELEEILTVGIQVADALAACHAKSIIHRDIKPANIFLTNSGQVKLLDFGVAKLAPGIRAGDAALDDPLTVAGDIFGTAVYMSPEQARGEELDARTDLFSLGVVLYQMATGQRPFIGANAVTTLEAVMNHKPMSPLKLNPNLPPELEGIIGRAMEKDRGNRYPDALAMKGDLESLKRETEPGMTETARMRPLLPYRISTTTFQTTSRRSLYILLGVIALLITILVPMGAWFFKQRSSVHARTTVAVLPLQNMNGDVSVEFLSFALADEIANALTSTRALDVRPFSMSRKFTGADVDPRNVAKQLRVGTVVTGHYLKQGDQLLVTLEAIEGSTDKLLWQKTLTAPAQDLIALQSAMSKEVTEGLLPAIGMAGGQAAASGTRPHDLAAYDLYLHALALPHDPKPNKDAIAVLEHAVAADPNYAPAWEELGWRDYNDSQYSDGGEEMFQRSTKAYERAVALDPNRVFAAGQLITNRVERGELGKAYVAAEALVQRLPENAHAHFVLGYVYRYAGMLEQSTQECEKAVALDPGNYTFRSCAWAFMELGDTKRAADFIKLDAGSDWAAYATPSLRLREGNIDEAREAVKKMPDTPRNHRDLLEACLGMGRPYSEAQQLAQVAERTPPAEPDAELLYYQGAIFADCGLRPAALRMLQAAIEQNYCAYSNLKFDPMLRKIRGAPGFDKLLEAARECQDRVRTATSNNGAQEP